MCASVCAAGALNYWFWYMLCMCLCVCGACGLRATSNYDAANQPPHSSESSQTWLLYFDQHYIYWLCQRQKMSMLLLPRKYPALCTVKYLAFVVIGFYGKWLWKVFWKVRIYYWTTIIISSLIIKKNAFFASWVI